MEDQDTPYEAFEEHSEKQEALRPTLVSIENQSQLSIARPSENPQKAQLIEDFISSLPDIVESEH